MSGAVARLDFACKLCGRRWTDETVRDAAVHHFKIDHADEDAIDLDLVAECRCGGTMDTTAVDGRLVYFRCKRCAGVGSLRTKPGSIPKAPTKEIQA